MSNEIEKITVTTELSVEELDDVAGGARRVAAAQTFNVIDEQVSLLEADRNGVRSANQQFTDKLDAKIFEITETGNP